MVNCPGSPGHPSALTLAVGGSQFRITPPLIRTSRPKSSDHGCNSTTRTTLSTPPEEYLLSRTNLLARRSIDADVAASTVRLPGIPCSDSIKDTTAHPGVALPADAAIDAATVVLAIPLLARSLMPSAWARHASMGSASADSARPNPPIHGMSMAARRLNANRPVASARRSTRSSGAPAGRAAWPRAGTRACRPPRRRGDRPPRPGPARRRCSAPG